MALPVTITDSAFPAIGYYCGPFKNEAGNYYAVLIETAGNRPEVFKATDPTTSFSAVGSAGRPTAVPRSMWAYQVGDILHIATQESNANGADVHYHTFSMATDAWTLTNELVETPVTKPGDADLGVSLVVRSNGDVILLYSGTTDTPSMTARARVDYARKVSGSWTVGIAVDGAGDVHWVSGVTALGSSDRAHFGVNDVTTPSAYFRTLLSDNTLQALPAAYDASPRIAYGHYPPKTEPFTSGANTRVVSIYPDNIGNTGKLSGVRFDSADTPTFTVTTGLYDTHSLRNVNSSPVACLATDETTVYLLYVPSVDSDLYSLVYTDDVGWAASPTLVLAGTINRVSSDVYIRGTRIVLGYLVDDAAVIKYNEIDLREAPAAGGVLRTRLLRGVGA